MNHIYIETNFPIENYKEELLWEYQTLKESATEYLFKNENFQWPSHSNYYILSNGIPIAQKVADTFKEMYDIKCYPRYYILKPGFVLDIHKDDGTQAAFNYLLSDDNDPIIYSIDDVEYEILYSKGLLNLQEYHRVPQTSSERILLKLSIYDYSFEECKRKIYDNENSNLR